MSIEVPPSEMLISPTLPMIIGRIAITLRSNAPKSVILESIFEIKSDLHEITY